ncbi:MAG: HAMP domain-containing histidine kinase [Planctomycetes bacterium]|nr:HAMP domain-containing histidine kinase [Planctomycetota bacterium]
MSLDEVLHEVRDRLAPASGTKGVTFQLPPQLPKVWGNKVRIREAIYNLVSNAVKFIDKPNGKITIGAETRANDVLLIIADNGPGVPPEELESIFVPFRRLPSHRHVPGSGLGLYFTKQLIETEGGRIWAESTLGEGCRFCVQLPTRRQGNG